MPGGYFSLSSWSNYCWPKKKTNLEEAEALFKKAFSSPLNTMYTYIGRVEGTIAPALLGFLFYVVATEKKLHKEPDEHQAEIGLLAFDALYLSIETTIVALEAYQKCSGSKANYEKLYKYLGRFGGFLSFSLIYLLADALKNEEKDVWDNPQEHTFEFIVILAEMVMLSLGNLAFDADIINTVYQYIAQKKPKHDTSLPADLHRDVNAALYKLMIADSYQGTYANTYHDLHHTAQALKEHDNTAHLAHYIERFLEESNYDEHKANEKQPLLTINRSVLSINN
ncbi:MAG: hypothetical protein WC748_09270 [Legionellales bacterium]|jgi:hypothetical protein